MKEETIVEKSKMSEDEKRMNLSMSTAANLLHLFHDYWTEARYFVPVAFWEAEQEEIEIGRKYKYTEVITPDTIRHCIFRYDEIKIENGEGYIYLRSDTPFLPSRELPTFQKIPAGKFLPSLLLPDPRDNIFLIDSPENTEMLAKALCKIFSIAWEKSEVRGRTLSANMKMTLEIAKRYPEKYDIDKMYAGYWSKIEGLKF